MFNIFVKNTIAIRVIIKIFNEIALFNFLIKNQQWILHNQLQATIINKRALYQKLIRCVIEAVENFNKRNDENSNEKINNQNEIMLKMLFIVVDFVDSIDVDFTNNLLTQFKKIKNRKFITSRFKKLLNLFNVHVELHLKKIATEYAIVINLNVLIKKMKHI